MLQNRPRLREGRYVLTMGFFIVTLLSGYAHSMPALTTDSLTTDATDCESDQSLVLVKGDKGKTRPGACPPNIPVQQGSAPPAGAIQINPTGALPDDAVCEAASNNSCAQQGYNCMPGKTCKDTWNASTHQCMCQCRS